MVHAAGPGSNVSYSVHIAVNCHMGRLSFLTVVIFQFFQGKDGQVSILVSPVVKMIGD